MYNLQKDCDNIIQNGIYIFLIAKTKKRKQFFQKLLGSCILLYQNKLWSSCLLFMNKLFELQPPQNPSFASVPQTLAKPVFLFLWKWIDYSLI